MQQVLAGDEVGSLIAMSFNEFGHILAAKEGSGLLLIYDANGDKIPERVRTYCDKVKNIQGILALNGEVYVTGEGPDGPGLYRLSDKDRASARVLDDESVHRYLVEDAEVREMKADDLEHHGRNGDTAKTAKRTAT